MSGQVGARSWMRRAVFAAALFPGVAAAQNVAVLGASNVTCGLGDVEASIGTTGRLQTVNSIDVGSSTPTLSQLSAYQAVLVFSDEVGFADPDALGRALAEIPGIVEHGLFPAALTERVVVAGADGTVRELVRDAG